MFYALCRKLGLRVQCVYCLCWVWRWQCLKEARETYCSPGCECEDISFWEVCQEFDIGEITKELESQYKELYLRQQVARQGREWGAERE